MPQTVFQHPLLCGDLRSRVEVLHAAASADGVVGATRRNAQRRSLDYSTDMGDFVVRLFLMSDITDHFARQRALDKDHFAFEVGNAATFLVQRLNADGVWHDCGAGSGAPEFQELAPVRFGRFLERGTDESNLVLIAIFSQCTPHE